MDREQLQKQIFEVEEELFRARADQTAAEEAYNKSLEQLQGARLAIAKRQQKLNIQMMMTDDHQPFALMEDKGKLKLTQRSTRKQTGDATLHQFISKRSNPQWADPLKLLEFSHDKQLKRTLTRLDEPDMVASALETWRRLQKFIAAPVLGQADKAEDKLRVIVQDLQQLGISKPGLRDELYIQVPPPNQRKEKKKKKRKKGKTFGEKRGDGSTKHQACLLD